MRAADSFELGQDPMDSLTGQGGLMFSRAAATEVRNLVTLHNLTDENLRYADSMGGIPVPSIGITKVESPFGGFGNITLIAPKGMIDPKAGVPVYDRDAWTARFPTMNFKKVKAKMADAFYERMKPVRELMAGDDDGFISQLWEQLRNASVQSPEKITSIFTRYDAGRVMYAKEVLGKTIKVPMRNVRPATPVGHDAQLLAYWKKHGAALILAEREMSGAEFSNTPENKAFEEEVQAAIRRYADAAGAPEIAKGFIEQMMPDGTMGAGTRDRLIRDFKTYGTKEVDRIKLGEAVNKAVKRDDPAYLRWVESLVKPLFDEPTITLRGREVAPTLDNIVDAMTVGATAGAEKSMTFSPGKVAAMLGKQFKSLDEIKAARDQVVSAKAETEGKKATDALLDGYRTHVSQFYGGKDWRGNIDTWAANDDSMEALAKAGKLPPSDASIRATLARMNFKGVDQRAVDMARDAIAALRNAATDYFEAKPQRAVTLDEFKGAVVPKGTSAETLAILEKHGIAVEVHNKTEGAREKAIQKLAKRLDRQSGDVLFTRSTDPSDPYQHKLQAIQAARKQAANVVQADNGQWLLAPKAEPYTAQEARDAQQRIDKLNRSLGKYSNVAPAAVLSDAPTPAMAWGRSIARTLGYNVTFIRPNPDFHGVAVGGDAFVSASAEHPEIGLIGHEVLHSFKQSDPDTYEALAERIRPYLKNGVVDAKRQWEDARGGQNTSMAMAEEEVFADLNGAMWLDPLFWREMASNDPSLFRQVAYKFMEVATKAMKGLSRFKADALVTDVDAVRKIIAQEWATQAQEMGNPSEFSETDGPAFSRTAGDQTQTEAFKRWFAGSKVVESGLEELLSKPDGVGVLLRDLLAAQNATGSGLNHVQALMLALAKNDKIGRGIVGLVPVDVVNSFSKDDLRPKDGGGNTSMFVNALNAPVSDQVLSTFRGILTSLSTKLANAIATGRDQEIAPALLASDFNLREVGGLLSLQGRTDFWGGNTGVKSVSAGEAAKSTSPGLGSPAKDFKLDATALADLFNKFVSFAPHAKTSTSDDLPSAKYIAKQGKPLVVYHGTSADIDAFDLAKSGSLTRARSADGAFWFSDSPELAGDYAALSKKKLGKNGARNVMPVFLKMENPKIVDMAGKSYHELAVDFGAMVQTARKGVRSGTDWVVPPHDGMILRNFSDTPSGRRLVATHYVAFHPEQIKSATGNRGTFDPANPDIRFSRADMGSRAGMSALAGKARDELANAAGAAIKSVTATNIKQRAGFKLTDYLGLGLQALGRRQIVDVYGDMLPLAEYNTLVQQMEADKNEGGAEADQLVTRWAKLDDEAKLADLMHEATLAQIDPAKPYVGGDDKAKYAMLAGRFNALSQEAKQVYTDTRDAYQAHHAKVRSAIKERIERSELKGPRKAELLKQMDDEFFAAVKGVYFPLARFGQYAVTVKGADGKVESVSRAETKAEAEALRNNLLSAFPRDKGFTVGRVMLSKDFIADRDAVGRGFMTELYQVLDKQDMDAAQRAELEDTLGQLYLSSLPDLSWAKHGIHRKGTPGFSQDARRAYAQNMFHGSRYLAKLRYSDLMQDELTAMQKHVDDWREVEDFDQNSAQRVVDEMNKRHESLMNPKSNPLSTALTSFGFVFHLGLSPASAMVNLSQTALVAYPIMGAKWGFGKASAALLKASAEATKGKNDITGSLNADERAAYDEAVRAGTIDVTMAHDLAGIAQGEDAGVMWKIRPVMRWASILFHHAERFNRQVTFVASYRLAREAGADQKAAFEQATKATYDGHFDYGAANRPRVMQGNVAKVLLLFKQYGQNMVYTLARNAQQSIKGESPEVRAQARKALGGLLATHAAAAGVLGLPMVTTLLAAASMIGGDDDEPWDAKVALQNMLADTLGQKPAEVLAHGLSRLTPWDISGRVGLDRLIFPDVQEGLEGQRLWESAATQALGPVGGIFGGALKGLDLMSDGHYKLGLEAMLPAVLRQGVKSIRYAMDGAQDKGGVVIKDEVSMPAVVGQLLGFSPSEVRLAQEGKSAIYQHDKALGERRQSLLTKAARATMDKDTEARAEAMKEIERFNQKNPARRITQLNVLQSVRNRNKRIDQAQDGVYLPKSRRDAMEAGRFALGD